MAIFEKIYITLFVINIVLLFIGFCVDTENKHSVYCIPFCLQLFLTLLYEVVRFVLLIWGIHIDIFPNVSIQ